MTGIDAPLTRSELLDIPPDEWAGLARARRDRLFANVVTYSPKVFIPLTMLCQDRCGYCTFAQPPARLDRVYLEPEEIVETALAGARVGCHEALFTLGERPELRYEAARAWLRERGYDSTIHYLADMAALVNAETGLLPHANAGALFREELAALRRVAPSQGAMVESINADVDAHRRAPDKDPQRRLDTLQWAGEAAIPFTTGVLVGIGESLSDLLDTIAAIDEVHRRYGHVNEVIVQNFIPKPATGMAEHPPCDPAYHRQAIAAARLMLSRDIHVQAPPNLSDDFGSLLDAGMDDWGGVSPITADFVNPERPWPGLDHLRAATAEYGKTLTPRLALHPAWALDPDRWVDPRLHGTLLDHSDAMGLARDDPGAFLPEFETPGGVNHVSTTWFAGSSVEPPVLVRGQAAACPPGPVAEVLRGVALGHEVGEAEIVTLFGARGLEVDAVCALADQLRRRAVGDEVTYVINRNINYTNVCTFKCRFCGFSKGPLSLNLRGNPYLLSLDELQARVAEAAAMGATEVTLQGGIHPSFDGDYYLDVCRAVREAAPDIHIHGFTALEVTEGAKRSGVALDEYLRMLLDAGLRSLPGTAAEILDDEVREVLCNDKVSTDEWLECHRIAHGVGLRSNITIMFGSVEQPRHWARHLLVTRDLQRETGGFTEFIPLSFVHMAAPIYLQRAARRGPTFREVVLMHAIGRIVYDGLIDNVQASWVKLGFGGVAQLLNAGVNDLGGTLMDENISRAAGAEHGQGVGPEDFERLVAPLGRQLAQRTTLYGRMAHS